MTRMQTAEKDFIQLSADATRAYQDLTISRFDIFDGRVDDAKKHIDDAVKGFDKAKTDETVFTKAEADMMPSKQTTNQPGTSQPSSDQAQKPIAWLPVDATVMINEDYTLNPAKSAAVADANKSLKSGDRKAAMEKLKLASLDTDVVMAVVPLDKTINDVHQAAQLIDSGKYYEGSQLLRQVQNAERFDSMDISGMPTKAANCIDHDRDRGELRDLAASIASPCRFREFDEHAAQIAHFRDALGKSDTRSQVFAGKVETFRIDPRRLPIAMRRTGQYSGVKRQCLSMIHVHMRKCTGFTGDKRLGTRNIGLQSFPIEAPRLAKAAIEMRLGDIDMIKCEVAKIGIKRGFRMPGQEPRL
jgi:hypothetical protein